MERVDRRVVLRGAPRFPRADSRFESRDRSRALARGAGEPDAGSRLAGDFLALAGDFLALAGDFLATVFFLAGA